ncbi:MAG: dTMP kinase [Gaiellales bacterium]
MGRVFITFEGIDGSGKSTQAAMLVARLREVGVDVVATREPGGTQLGEQVRSILLETVPVAPWPEAALFAAARAQLVADVIRPALDAGRWVVSDRYLDSSLAYQGVARGLGIDAVLALNGPAVANTLPAWTFVLDVPPEEAAARLTGDRLDRIEEEGLAFLAAVAAGYAELAGRYPGRIVTISGVGSVQSTAERVEARLRTLAPGLMLEE